MTINERDSKGLDNKINSQRFLTEKKNKHETYKKEE